MALRVAGGIGPDRTILNGAYGGSVSLRVSNGSTFCPRVSLQPRLCLRSLSLE